MTTDQARKLIHEDEDFVYCKRFNFSLAEMEKRHPDGCPDRLIAAVLMITEDDVTNELTAIVLQLRDEMGVEDDDDSL